MLGLSYSYFCLFKKLQFSTFYQISVIEISQHRSDLLTERNDNIKSNMLFNSFLWPLEKLEKNSQRLPC